MEWYLSAHEDIIWLMDLASFQSRIGYKGHLNKVLTKVVEDYNLGTLKTFDPILQGYEDFNVKIQTDLGIYLVKMMASTRSSNEVKQYADIMELVVRNNVSHPRIYKSSQGSLHEFEFDRVKIRLVVMDFVNGNDFYRLNEKPTVDEIAFLAREAAKISKINFKPQYVYDSWAIPNFLKEFDNIKDKLDREDRLLIEPLASSFSKLDLGRLPHCFVHGDIIATNVLRSDKGRLFIIDFAVANWNPRIQELAVLLCDLFFSEDKKIYLRNYNLALEEYQKLQKLEQREIDVLPIFIILAHAMHIISATREKIKGTMLTENDFWLKSGQKGIRVALEIWNGVLELFC